MTGGQKKAFTVAQVQYLSGYLSNKASQKEASSNKASQKEASRIDVRNAALFRMAVCSMLRASDLLRLNVNNVWDIDSGVKSEFKVQQKKTGTVVTCHISEVTQKVLNDWLRKEFGDELYGKGDFKIFDISERQYRNIVIQWAKNAGLNSKLYSTHSLRRTKPKEIYAQTQNIEMIRRLLGHKSIQTTSVYLGVEEEEAAAVARSVEI